MPLESLTTEDLSWLLDMSSERREEWDASPVVGRTQAIADLDRIIHVLTQAIAASQSHTMSTDASSLAPVTVQIPRDLLAEIETLHAQSNAMLAPLGFPPISLDQVVTFFLQLGLVDARKLREASLGLHGKE